MNLSECPVHSYLAQLHIMFSLYFGGQLKAFLWKCTKKNQHKYDNKLFPVHRKCLVVASSQICQQLFYKEADISVFNSRYDAGANKSELVVETTHPALSELKLKFLLLHTKRSTNLIVHPCASMNVSLMVTWRLRRHCSHMQWVMSDTIKLFQKTFNRNF